jgi:AcrR family transcriptional regulator
MAAQPNVAQKPRRPLTRERVLRTAVELADARGIESLTMRNLAKELGVEAMSLYNHVAGKEDVLDGVAEVVVGEVLAAHRVRRLRQELVPPLPATPHTAPSPR